MLRAAACICSSSSKCGGGGGGSSDGSDGGGCGGGCGGCGGVGGGCSIGRFPVPPFCCPSWKSFCQLLVIQVTKLLLKMG